MIQPQGSRPPNHPVGFIVIERAGALDLDRFAWALAMLESYVDELLMATDLPAMDPWVNDEVEDVRLASL